jgi:hypothetical protein
MHTSETFGGQREGMANEPHGREALRLADVFARRSRLRIRQLFAEIGTNADESTYRLGMDVLKGKYACLEEGALLEHDAGPDAPPSPGAGAAGTAENRAPI